MNKFIKVARNSISISKMGTLVEGVGTNDSWFMTEQKVNGKRVTYPIYKSWGSMLRRCYSEKYQTTNPTYKGCTVCDEWLTFSNFDEWCEENYVDGCVLDKDLKFKSNKIYSPDSCLFVPVAINALLTDRHNYSGVYPQGVSWHKAGSKYSAQLSVDGKRKHLGLFKTPEQASLAYIIAKNDEYDRKSIQYPKFAIYLQQHKLQNTYEN